MAIGLIGVNNSWNSPLVVGEAEWIDMLSAFFVRRTGYEQGAEV